MLTTEREEIIRKNSEAYCKCCGFEECSRCEELRKNDYTSELLAEIDRLRNDVSGLRETICKLPSWNDVENATPEREKEIREIRTNDYVFYWKSTANLLDEIESLRFENEKLQNGAQFRRSEFLRSQIERLKEELALLK